MHDPIYFLRSYGCTKSRQARDNWLTFREGQGMPVVQHLDRFDAVPNAFAKQWAAMRK